MKNDVTYLAILFALFAISILFVKALDRMIGPDEVALGQRGEDSREPEPLDERPAA